MSMYFGCELKDLDIDEILSGIRYIDPEDLVVLYREKIRRLESMLRNSEDGAEKLMAKIRELEDENINLTEMNEELDGKDDILRDRMAELEKENEELQNKVKYLKISNRNLRTVIINCNINTRHSISKTCEGLQEENKRLKEELELVREDNDKFTEDIKQVVKEKNALENQLGEANKKLRDYTYGKYTILEWNELVAENRRLQEEKAFFESQVDILSTTCDRHMDNINVYIANIDAYKNDVKRLTQENNELKAERDALWDQNKYSDKMYNQLMNDKKRLQENFEELKASSDLSMTAELAAIFDEFTDKDDKNRADLSVKIDKFKEKYQFE